VSSLVKPMAFPFTPSVARAPITVTRPTLPPFEEYAALLEGIWKRNHLTNAGPLVVELEQRLAEQLGVKHCLFVSNGTIALQLVFRALELAGEVITTPFSYVATTSSIAWEGSTPVFADVEPGTLTLSAERAEAAMTSRTSAIVATHVYGNACDVDALGELARRRGLRLVYDAAHAFGASYRERPLSAYGDVATLSFHATKLFHTVEGGAVVTDDDEIARRVAYLRNFGHDGYERFQGIGINGKNSELHAAMGLCLLPRVPAIVAERRTLSLRYDAALAGRGDVVRPAIRAGTAYNYAYYPVLLPGDAAVRAAQRHLECNGVLSRRYFYPSLSGALPYVAPGDVPVARDAAERVLCLPLYTGLAIDQVDRIAELLVESLDPAARGSA
jgi:dTDP-4-amino-4,6-dideoxygalactose transaminase